MEEELTVESRDDILEKDITEHIAVFCSRRGHVTDLQKSVQFYILKEETYVFEIS